MKHLIYMPILIGLSCLDFAAVYAQPAAGISIAPRDDWDIAQIHATRLGFGHTTIEPRNADGRAIVAIAQTMHLALERLGQPTSFEVNYAEKQTLQGELLSFALEIRQGPTPQQIEAHVKNGRLLMVDTSQGKQQQSEIAWPEGTTGLMGPEMSLLRYPLKAGEHRVVSHYDLGNQITATDMTAVNEEKTKLPTGTFPLLRIDVVDKMAGGQKLERKLWTDRAGNVVKSWTKMLDLETYRVSKDVAMAKTELPKLDLLTETLVKVDRAIAAAHAAKKIRYQVHLVDENPCKVFLSCPSQEVKPIDEHTAEITVYALRPGDNNRNLSAKDAPPTDDDRKPNNFIQSDDPLIVANAEKAAGGMASPWKVAMALERFVNKEVTEKDFSQAFATASDVARSHEGDCTEHAVYLAALARAEGIPARVAIGLVYMQGSQTFGYHMWTEVYIDKRWIPIDATLAHGGIGGGHLKVATSSLAGSSAYSSFIPVAQVIGKLSVKVLEVSE